MGHLTSYEVVLVIISTASFIYGFYKVYIKNHILWKKEQL